MGSMDTIYPPVVNLIARIFMLLGLFCYGWFWGDWAGLLAMGFVVCFLAFGLRSVVSDGVVGSVWAALKWFLYFLAFHFAIFVIDEPLSDNVLDFMGTTLSGIVAWIRR